MCFGREAEQIRKQTEKNFFIENLILQELPVLA